jgi:hypothetical protein
MPSGATIAARTNTANVPPGVATPHAVKPAPFFPIGVWYQPVTAFAKWKARGVNTLIGIELDNGGFPGTPDQRTAYVKAAHDAGFKVVADHPDADWMLNGPDEPDGQGNVTPAAYKLQYASIKSANPGKPVWGTFDGEKTRWRPRTDYVGGYFDGVDVIAPDWYPCNRGMVPEDGFSIFAERVAWSVSAAAGKPVWMAIETCDQNMRGQGYLHEPANQPVGEKRAAAMRGPTPDELAAEVSTAVARGATGIYYFPHVVGPPWSSFDGTPDDVAARMTAVNASLNAAAPPVVVTPPPAKGDAAPSLPDTLTINGFQFDRRK